VRTTLGAYDAPNVATTRSRNRDSDVRGQSHIPVVSERMRNDAVVCADEQRSIAARGQIAAPLSRSSPAPTAKTGSTAPTPRPSSKPRTAASPIRANAPPQQPAAADSDKRRHICEEDP
jgi:hypothetical protein